MERVILKSNGRLYRIPKAPYEPVAQTSERGWTLVELTKNATEEMRSQKQKEWIQQSFIDCFTKQGLTFE